MLPEDDDEDEDDGSRVVRENPVPLSELTKASSFHNLSRGLKGQPLMQLLEAASYILANPNPNTFIQLAMQAAKSKP